MSAPTLRETTRGRILDRFERKARVDGPRAVVMAELARELGMSTRTLYQHFPSKKALVQETMRRWADRVERGRAERAASGRDLLPRMEEAMVGWVESQSFYSTAFWDQLARDHPEADALVREQMRRSLSVGRDEIIPLIRRELDPQLAFSLLRRTIRTAIDPGRCDRLGLTRAEAVRQAVGLWFLGAVQPKKKHDRS